MTKILGIVISIIGVLFCSLGWICCMMGDPAPGTVNSPIPPILFILGGLFFWVMIIVNLFRYLKTID